MTFFRMYVNLVEKFGKDSPEVKRYRNYLNIYSSKPHIMKRIYDVIMKNAK